jgi:endonuclease
MPLYQKPVRELMRDMVTDLGLSQGEVVAREKVIEWFRVKYPLVKQGTIAAHLLRMSTNAPSRLHHNLREDGSDDLFYQLDAGHFRLYDSHTDPAPIRSTPPGDDSPPTATSTEEASESSEFAYEHDLRDYLAKNLHLIEAGLRLYRDEDGITGVEFPVGGRFIDILAVDSHGSYVVIELKVSRGYDRVVGQLLRYIGWIEQHHAEPSQAVRGVIVAKEVSNDLRLACRRVQGVRLFEYTLAVALTPVVNE